MVNKFKIFVAILRLKKKFGKIKFNNFSGISCVSLVVVAFYVLVIRRYKIINVKLIKISLITKYVNVRKREL